MELAKITESGAAVLSFGFAVIVCFGGIGNALDLVTQIKFHKKLLKDSKDILTFSLAIGDFIMSLIITPLAFSSAVAMRWTMGRGGCIAYGLIITWTGLASILQLTCIALERYYTLSHPHAGKIPRKRAIQAVLVCWSIALVASLLPLFGFSRYTFEGFGLHCAIVWRSDILWYVWYCLALLFLFYAIPIVAIGISYCNMFHIVRKICRSAEVTWGSNSQLARQSYAAQVKFTRQSIVVTCGFLMAWTPYAVMSSLQVLTDFKFDNGWYELPSLFAKTANIYNPIIYFFMYKRLRRHVFIMLQEKWKTILPD